MSRFVLQTWNCFGTAQSLRAYLAQQPPDPHRFDLPEIRAAIEDADVVCMQELFLGTAESFFDGLGHDHKLRDVNTPTWWPFTIGGSGLGIASRYPIIEKTQRAFSRPHTGSERFARKGLLHARVQVAHEAEILVDVLTTHFQSGYDDQARAVRARQITELRLAVDEVGSADRAFLVCGDMNICGLGPSRSEGEYQRLAGVLSEFIDVGAEADLPTFHPDPTINPLCYRFERGSPVQRLDYVFFRPARAASVDVEECSVTFQKPFDTNGHGPTFASDHFGLKVHLRVGDPPR